MKKSKKSVCASFFGDQVRIELVEIDKSFRYSFLSRLGSEGACCEVDKNSRFLFVVSEKLRFK